MEQAKHVLFIDNSLNTNIYSPVGHWSRHVDCDFDTVMPPMGEFPHRFDKYSHVIITGSEASIMTDEEWISAECELVREMAGAQVPILASCFGLQLVVKALSGKEYVQPATTPEFGWIPTVLSAPDGRRDQVFGALPASFFCFTSHFDEVSPLPDDWTRLAWSEDCANAVLKWNEGPVWGIQAHPEINFEDGDKLLKALPRLRPDKADLMQRFLHPAHKDSTVTNSLVESFLINA